MSKTKKIIILFGIFFVSFIIFSLKSDAYCWPIANKNGAIDYKTSYIEYGYGKRVYTVDKNLWKNEINYSKTETHHGVDITGTPNTTYKIVSVSDGTVIGTSANRATSASISFPNNNHREGGSYRDGGGYGNYVLIKDSQTNFVFLYAHLAPNTITVKKGDSVRLGQVIGTMGSSGNAGHMHLHFEIRKNISCALATPSAARSNMKITSVYDYQSSSSVTISPVKYIYTYQMATDFVTDAYKNILGRSPDTNGLNNKVQAMMNGKSQGEIIASFYNSPEFKNKHYNNSNYVEKLYSGCLQRKSDYSGKQHWVNLLNSGRSRSDVLNSFIKSREFKNICTSYYARDFVSTAYKNVLNRNADAGGLKSHTNTLISNNSAASILYSLYNSTEFNNKKYNNSNYIEKLYNGCLQRKSDSSGKQHWLNTIKNGTSKNNVLKRFLSSLEYQKLIAKKYGLSNIGI